MAEGGRSGFRWLWPALGIAISGLVLWGIWTVDLPELHGQRRVMLSGLVGLLLGALLFVWWLAEAPCSRRIRRWTSLTMLAGVIGFLAAFEFRGVSGDLVPEFEWRWSTRSTVRGTPPPTSVRPVHVDYPQFRGPQRNGHVAGAHLARDWESAPPRLRWRRPVGTGWSSFSVEGTRAVTQEQHGEEERVVCYDLFTGDVLWSVSDHARYESALAGSGPRSTPTITGGRVYTFGSTGILNAIDIESGARIWTHDVVTENGSEILDFGTISSPLLHEELVIVSAGGRDGRSLVAYRAGSGELAWTAGDDAASYSSPVFCHLAGADQVIAFNAASVAAHDPGTGRVLWTAPFSARQVHVTMPLALGSKRLLVSAGYGEGTTAFEISASEGVWSASVAWRSRRLKSKFSNWILHAGALFAFDDGIFTAIDPETGQRLFKDGRFGHGQMVLAGDLLLIQTEEGEVLLVEPNTQELRILSRLQALDGKVWNAPAFAAPYLLVRNDVEAAVYELPARATER